MSVSKMAENKNNRAFDECSDKELAMHMAEIREEINRRASSHENETEGELYLALAGRLAETQQHLEGMHVSRNPEVELTFDAILEKAPQ
jgi:hypothetical protein